MTRRTIQPSDAAFRRLSRASGSGSGVADGNDISVLTDNGDGTFTHSAGGVVTTFDARRSTVADNGDGTFTITDDNGNAVTITGNVAETVTTLSVAGNVLTYTAEDGGTTNIDLSLYLDDTNLARLTSATVDAAGIATFTRDDASTFTLDLSSLLPVTAATSVSPASDDAAGAVGTSTDYARADHKHPAQGVSADAGQALTVGSDSLPYLSNAEAPNTPLHKVVYSLSADASGIIIPWDEAQGDVSEFTNTAGVITVPAGKYRISAYATRSGSPADYELFDVTNSVSLERYSASVDGALGSNKPVYLTVTTPTDICVREGNGDANILWNGREDGYTAFTGALKPWSCYLDIQQLPENVNVVAANTLTVENLSYGRLSTDFDLSIAFTPNSPFVLPFSVIDYASGLTASTSNNGFTVADSGRYNVNVDILADDINIDARLSIFVNGSPVFSEEKNLNVGYNSFSFNYNGLALNGGDLVTIAWTTIDTSDTWSLLKGTSFSIERMPEHNVVLSNDDLQIVGGTGAAGQKLLANGDGTASFADETPQVVDGAAAFATLTQTFVQPLATTTPMTFSAENYNPNLDQYHFARLSYLQIGKVRYYDGLLLLDGELPLTFTVAGSTFVSQVQGGVKRGLLESGSEGAATDVRKSDSAEVYVNRVDGTQDDVRVNLSFVAFMA